MYSKPCQTSLSRYSVFLNIFVKHSIINVWQVLKIQKDQVELHLLVVLREWISLLRKQLNVSKNESKRSIYWIFRTLIKFDSPFTSSWNAMHVVTNVLIKFGLLNTCFNFVHPSQVPLSYIFYIPNFVFRQT